MERSTVSPANKDNELRGVYRGLQFSDCGEIVAHYNRHLKSEDPIWCSSGSPYTAAKLWAHYLSLMVRGRRTVLTQVHRDESGGFISYFGGYKRSDEATFTIGIVNLDCGEPMEIWRQDSAVFFGSLLEDGIKRFRLSLSDDGGKIVSWIEGELGFERFGKRNIWIGDGEMVEKYVSSQLVG